MVQVIENATRLYGTVLSVRATDSGTQITLRVERSEPVEGLASLLQPIPGSQVELLAAEWVARSGFWLFVYEARPKRPQ